MLKNFCAPVFALIGLSAPLLFADDSADTVVFSRPVLSMSQEGARVVEGGKYINVGGNLKGDWFLPTIGAIDFQAQKNQRLGLDIRLAATYFVAPDQYAAPQNYVRNISVTLPRVDASYIFGNLAHPFLRADVGILNYKYNEYSRNLGEYMFRTWAYPGIIQTGGAYGYVGNNTAIITGLRLSQSLGMFSHEFLATFETEMTPVYDLNLTYMAKFNYHNILKIGGGIQLARVASADLTSPNTSEMTTHYFEENGVWYAGDAQGSGYYSALQAGIESKLARPGVSAADSARLNAELAQTTLALSVLDSVSTGQIHPNMHPLTPKAVKPVAYFSFDPKPLIGSNLFGAKDLVLYGEAAILGVKSYPVYYHDIWQRIPVTLGFNVPTFRILDVLSIEAEYYGSRWLPTYWSPATPHLSSSPVPFMAGEAGPYYPSDWDKDNWKWSVYAERTIIHGVTVSAQAASDHARTWDWVYFGKTPWEMYTTPSQWYWALKLE